MIALMMQRLMIQADPEEQVPPPLTCVGAFDSGRSDLSELASDHIFMPRSWR
jgi:hypothetical protein